MSRISRLVLSSALALAVAGMAGAEEPAKKDAAAAQQKAAGQMQQMQQQRRAWVEQAKERNRKLEDLVARVASRSLDPHSAADLLIAEA